MPIKLHENLDPAEVTKRRLRAAEEVAEGEISPAAAAKATMSQSQFGRPYSAAEREMHDKALLKLLRERK